MPRLIAYLFGPGRYNEHRDQHLIAAYDDCGASDDLWRSEPDTLRQLGDEPRRLGWELDFPQIQWGGVPAQGEVWHCSLSVSADEGPLSDEQWAEAARTLVDKMGFTGSAGRAPCRWVAVWHGPSTSGNPHIHVVVNRIRTDGTYASIWRDYHAVGRVCAEMESRFGLAHVDGRLRGASLGEASRADREASQRHGDSEPLRVRMERRVRAYAAAARNEADFVRQLRIHGLLVKPRWITDVPEGMGHRSRARPVGYSVADPVARRVRDHHTGYLQPIWFSGHVMATDLSLPQLRVRWHQSGQTATARTEAAWRAAEQSTSARLTRRRLGSGRRSDPVKRARAAARTVASAHSSARSRPGGQISSRARVTPSGTSTDVRVPHEHTWQEAAHAARPVADMLAAAALAAEPNAPGRLSTAARHLARAVQVPTRVPVAMAPPSSNGGNTGRSSDLVVVARETVREVADVFLTTTLADASSPLATLLLVREVAGLVDILAETFTASREVQQARTLTHAGLTDMTMRAHAQSVAGLVAITGLSRMHEKGRHLMTDMYDGADVPAHDQPPASHEEETLRLGTQATIAAASMGRIIAALGQAERSGPGQDAHERQLIKELRARGVQPQTTHDAHLKALMLEQENGAVLWSEYERDPARIICAAIINDCDMAGIDTDHLLETVVKERKWYDDPSVAIDPAHILSYRLKNAIRDGRYRMLSSESAGRPVQEAVMRTAAAAAPASGLAAGMDAGPDALLRERAGRALDIPFANSLAADLITAFGPAAWLQLLDDARHRDVAETLRRARTDGRDVPALISTAVHATALPSRDRDPETTQVVPGLLHQLSVAMESGAYPSGSVDWVHVDQHRAAADDEYLQMRGDDAQAANATTPADQADHADAAQRHQNIATAEDRRADAIEAEPAAGESTNVPGPPESESTATESDARAPHAADQAPSHTDDGTRPPVATTQRGRPPYVTPPSSRPAPQSSSRSRND